MHGEEFDLLEKSWEGVEAALTLRHRRFEPLFVTFPTRLYLPKIFDLQTKFQTLNLKGFCKMN